MTKSVDDYIEELKREPIAPLPKDHGKPVFQNSWEAEAYAIGNLLVKSGFLSAAEWMERMGASIKSAQKRGDQDRGDTYYFHWMDALENLCVDRGLTTSEDYANEVRLWDLAIENTPHGVAIVRENALLTPDAPNPHLAHPLHGQRHHHHHHHEVHDDEHLNDGRHVDENADRDIICGPRQGPPANFYEPAAVHRQ
jgi:nitrile hydratase accessory protein